MDIALSTTLHTTFDDAVVRTREALAQQGFGVLTEIDVKATLKAKLDEDIEDYLILGACNPPLAHQAISVDRQIGLLLPCNVVVRSDLTDDGAVIVEAMNPQVLIWGAFCQVGRGKRRPRPSSWPPLRVDRMSRSGCRACRCRRVVKSEMRGLVTAGRDFRVGVGPLSLEIEREPRCGATCLLIELTRVTPRRLPTPYAIRPDSCGVVRRRRGRPTTSTSRPVHARSRRWRPPSVSYARRNRPSGCAGGCWRHARGPGRPGPRRSSARADRGWVDTGRGGARPPRRAGGGHGRYRFW